MVLREHEENPPEKRATQVRPMLSQEEVSTINYIQLSRSSLPGLLSGKVFGFPKHEAAERLGEEKRPENKQDQHEPVGRCAEWKWRKILLFASV